MQASSDSRSCSTRLCSPHPQYPPWCPPLGLLLVACGCGPMRTSSQGRGPRLCSSVALMRASSCSTSAGPTSELMDTSTSTRPAASRTCRGGGGPGGGVSRCLGGSSAAMSCRGKRGGWRGAASATQCEELVGKASTCGTPYLPTCQRGGNKNSDQIFHFPFAHSPFSNNTMKIRWY